MDYGNPVLPFDIDQDGDQDYLVGNWGMNSKFKASQDFPMKMYYDDFDANGSFETIVAIEKKGKILHNFRAGRISGTIQRNAKKEIQ